MKIIIVLIVATLAASSWAMGQCSIDRCFLLNFLRNTKMDEQSDTKMDDDLVANFMCIADHASGFDILQQKTPGLHGIFQISDENWCQGEKKCGSKNLCNLPCSRLQDLNLRDDTQCAMKIYKSEGLKAWPEWVTNCQNKDLKSYLEGC